MDFITLRALAREWDARLGGARVTAAWTQSPSELSVAVERGGAEQTLRLRCDPALPLVWRTDGEGRQRRNTADVLPALVGRTVQAVRTPPRDRFLVADLDAGDALWVRLFGPRPNALLVESGRVADAFLAGGDAPGDPAPETRPAPHPETADAFAERWRPRKTLAQSVRGAVPLLHPALAADAVRRAGHGPDEPAADADPHALWPGVAEVLAALADPAPHVLWRGRLAEALVPARPAYALSGWRAEPFETFDRAADVYARRALAQAHYRSLYAPVEAALARLHARRSRSAASMLEELANPSRADAYEAYGHLLMAAGAREGPGRESVELDDIVAGTGERVTIPLDPALGAIENAERYYDRARRARRARAEAEARWDTAQAETDALGALLARLRATGGLADLRAFLDAEEAALAQHLRPQQRGEAAEPFRRIALPGGYEALVGKHARGNAHVTTREARPHDLWLHARGVPGSHVVVRVRARGQRPPRETVEAAARLAARFSDARTQALVPVSVTERKYVRPVKGGAPGRVRVDREDVLLVEPADG